MPSHPVLILNPKSGGGRFAAMDVVHAAQGLGIDAVVMEPGDDLAELAHRTVDRGGDHLLVAGGDGSLAIIAEVAMERDLPFSCVPVGTRNHFAMDLGLDRTDPITALAAARDGSERSIDVGMVGGRVFLNNVSFGLYPRAIADPDYRRHRGRSMADAAIGVAIDLENHITVTSPDGRVIADVEVLLASNNPYRFIGPPDFAGRPDLDRGTLGILMTDRQTRLERGPAALRRWDTQTLMVHSDAIEISAGVDGELRTFRGPVEVGIAPKALRVLVPRHTQSRSVKESIGQINERAIAHLSGVPSLPRRSGPSTGSIVLRRIDEIDAATFDRIAALESPAMDRLMPALSEAASHSKIWIAASIGMSLVGGQKGRRAALQGLTAVAITSILANLVAKGLVRRTRPNDEVPVKRRLPMPDSSSMPSGHTASAASFASSVGAIYPTLRIPLEALAVAIGFSRVYTGVHHPTDVLAGWTLGTGIGTLTHASVGRARAHHHPTDGRQQRRVLGP